MIPGPVSLSPDVAGALAQPVRPHYGKDWVREYSRVRSDMAEVFMTTGTVVLPFGPGTAGIEMALASVLARGDEVLIPSNGAFADRMHEISETLGLKVHKLRFQDSSPIDVQTVRDTLRSRPGIRALGLVHHETIVGIVNPIQQLTSLARDKGLLTIVDAVSSLGGIEVRMDDWNIDVCVTVANKCLGGPVGVAPMAVSARAWDAVDDGRTKAAGWYLNLKTWRSYQEMWAGWHPHPTTMPSMAIVALGVAVRRILENGLQDYLERQQNACRRVREGLRELGFQLFVADEVASPVTTTVLAVEGMDVDGYIEWLARNSGLRVAGGTGALAGRIFRVSHMATASEPAVVESFLAATRRYVSSQHWRAS